VTFEARNFLFLVFLFVILSLQFFKFFHDLLHRLVTQECFFLQPIYLIVSLYQLIVVVVHLLFLLLNLYQQRSHAVMRLKLISLKSYTASPALSTSVLTLFIQMLAVLVSSIILNL
jgi:hypothetical protein